jgi:DNA polymerase zeta
VNQFCFYVAQKSLLKLWIALSRGHLLPNPEQDSIEAIFYCFQDDDVPTFTVNYSAESESSTVAAANATTQRRVNYTRGCIAVNSEYSDPRRIREAYFPLSGDGSGGRRTINIVESEVDLINSFLDQVMEWDPDVITGWELQNSSWGYLADRAQTAYGEWHQLSAHLRSAYNGEERTRYC